MPLNEAQKQKLRDWFKDKGARPTCVSCGANEWGGRRTRLHDRAEFRRTADHRDARPDGATCLHELRLHNELR